MRLRNSISGVLVDVENATASYLLGEKGWEIEDQASTEGQVLEPKTKTKTKTETAEAEAGADGFDGLEVLGEDPDPKMPNTRTARKKPAVRGKK